jgi:Ras-related protein Rab-1A
VLLIGNSGVGKSSLLLRFADDVFTDNFMPTIGVDFKIRTIEVDGKTIKLQIWDTAGQERFKTITSSYYKGAHGIIVTYDITDRESFSAIENWMNEVEKHASDNISRILVGNKSDMTEARQVSTDEGKELAEHYNVRFLETSAKDCKNVEEAFTMMTREIKSRVAIAKPTKPTAETATGSTKITNKSSGKKIQEKKGGCC